ncbi:2,3-dimethylmalate lyase isoform X1 [Juglans microcarpa x Juglans regia]|uniref:2,3-dimethylmalate lyase isoform X1 n=1 Tax=Juglans microcarpa x Juglans regia TaxID=2249226 RepID=UPI001B7F11C0|nr:2,3-dimethylmalate lyase isoform X1 [Juglans microcarpa x Juglans regia]XP_041025622.1 2,3-dimethylmalate lyase isoform X1 [Juglans microcarpa x Juglans regia]
MEPALVLGGGGSFPHIPSLAIRSTSSPPFLGFTLGSRIQWSISLVRNPIQQKSHTRLALARAAERDHSVTEPPAKALRRILDLPGVHQGPACFDALSAKLVEKAGFQYCFSSGFSISAARLGLPDVGLISYGEMLDQGQQITQAVSIPVIGDGDNGYGNAMNVKRTVKGYISAGFAGIILEDQVSPKACGHTQGRKVVPREEAIMKIKAAIDARKESGSDIVIVARTDSRQAVSLDESLWRCRAFADAGADVLFIDALASKEEMKAFCEISPLVPKMANMLEGGGKTPILNPLELEDIGYKLVSYPLSLIGASIQAMQDSLAALRGGRIPPPRSMPSFEEIKEILGFNTYYKEEQHYATSTNQLSSQRVSSSRYSMQNSAQDDTKQRGRSPDDPIVEVITPYVYNNDGADGSRDPFSQIWSRTLRIKITGRDGFERLDVRIPAGFLEGITNIVPALGGVNIKALLDDAADEVGGKQLLDFIDTMGDRIQVFLE